MPVANIVVNLRMVDELSKTLRTVRQNVNQFGQTTKVLQKGYTGLKARADDLNKHMVSTTKVVQSARIANQSFGQVMGMNLAQWRRYNALGGQFKTLGGRIANRFRVMTHGLRGFRMEMLGVMFFGMGLSQFFKGLLRPALDLVGVFQLLTTTLGILFLPIAMLLLNVVIWLLEKISSLPEPVKIAIGVFVLLSVIFWSLIFLFGMFALGVGSLIQAFGGMTAVRAGISGAISAIGAAMLPILFVFGIIVAAIISFADAWKTNFGGIREWTRAFVANIKEIFIGLWASLKAIFKLITAIWRDDEEKMREAIDELFEGMKQAIKGGFKALGAAIVMAGLTTLNALKRAIGGLFTWVKSVFLKPLEKTIDRINEIMDKLREFGEKTGVEVGGFGYKILKFFKKPKEIPATAPPTGVKQLGGLIPHTGLYKLHRKEFVIPANLISKLLPKPIPSPEIELPDIRLPEIELPEPKVMKEETTNISFTFTPNISVTAASDVDIDTLSTKLSTDVVDKVNRLIRR